MRLAVTNMASTIEKLKERLLCNPKIKMVAFNFPQGINSTTSLSDILEDSVDEKYFLSPEATERIFGLVKTTSINQTDRVYLAEGISPTLNTSQGGRHTPSVALPQPNANA